MSYIDSRWEDGVSQKNLIPSFLENHKKYKKRLSLKIPEKWSNDEKMSPMVILGQNKYHNSSWEKIFKKFFLQFLSEF